MAEGRSRKWKGGVGLISNSSSDLRTRKHSQHRFLHLGLDSNHVHDLRQQKTADDGAHEEFASHQNMKSVHGHAMLVAPPSMAVCVEARVVRQRHTCIRCFPRPLPRAVASICAS